MLTILVTLGTSRIMARVGPARVVPWGYLASAALHLAEWTLLRPQTQRLAAVAVYLHVSIVPVLISGFWSILSDGIDPRANRRQMMRAALAGSIGGVVGG